MNETIKQKAERILGPDRRDVGKLLRAIFDGEWAPEDARALKEHEECKPKLPVS